jgi:hypothetical protein
LHEIIHRKQLDNRQLASFLRVLALLLHQRDIDDPAISFRYLPFALESLPPVSAVFCFVFCFLWI